MNLSPYDIIRRQRVTEKAVFLQNAGSYTFEVHPTANKKQVRAAIEQLFGVSVTSVHTMNVDGKQRRTRYGLGRTAAWKKAIVTVADGQQIEGL